MSARLVCTLARQLICHGATDVREAILQAVRDNRDVETMRMDDQFKFLLVDPLHKIGGDIPPVLLVIDAIDECDDLEYAVAFVKAIDRHSSSLGANVRFLITSRPEDVLVRSLQRPEWQEDDLDTVPGTTEDIATFLRAKLSTIGKEFNLLSDWAPETAVCRLAELSQGLFQWAHTALKYIGEGVPERRLRMLLNAPTGWAGLDDLYHQILSKAFCPQKLAETEIQFRRRVLGIIVGASYPVSLEIVAYLCADDEALSSSRADEKVKYLRFEVLGGLTPMLSIPTSPGDPIQFMHTSIRDFLVDAKRCHQKSYFIDLPHQHYSIALQCIRLMRANLRQNICCLSDLSKPNLDLEIQNLVHQHISEGLQYCCRSWSIHLVDGFHAPQLDPSLKDLRELEQFSQEKLLCWLEVMALIGASTEAIAISKQVAEWLTVSAGALIFDVASN